MSNVILITEMREIPTECGRCELCRKIVGGEESWAICGYEGVGIHLHEKPDWCRLHILPDKLNQYDSHGNFAIDCANVIAVGWNKCLDAITGEGKNEQSTCD